MLTAEASRLEREGLLTGDEAAALDLPALAAFWNSKIGRGICAQGEFVRRELPFTARFLLTELDEIILRAIAPDTSDEFVVVQGVADLAVILPQEIWLLDFKTDELKRDEIAKKLKFYEPQLQVYGLALTRIYNRPVTNCWLHFVSRRETLGISLPYSASGRTV